MNQSLQGSQDNLQTGADFLPWNSPGNLISHETYLTTTFYLDAVVKPIVFVIGVPTNLLNCLVFKQQGLRDRMNLCLFALVFVDMTYLAYSMLFTTAFCIRKLEPAIGEELYTKMQYYGISINYGLRETSAGISVLIAVERCVCVVFPLLANTLISTRTMSILLATIVIGMQLAFVTTPVKKRVFPVYDNTTGETRWAVAPSAAWQENQALMLYDKMEDTFMMIVFPLFTFILVSGATAITVIKLRAAILWRKKIRFSGSDAQDHQVALTKMLVLVSCVFIASKAPWVAITVTRIFYPDFSPSGSQSNLYRVLEVVAHYCLYIHSAVNFFIYYSRSSRFKSNLRAVGGCWHKSSSQSQRTGFVSTVTRDLHYSKAVCSVISWYDAVHISVCSSRCISSTS